MHRTIKKVWKSEPTIEGAGVHLRRAFGFHEIPLLDPFLLLDDFRSENPAEYLAGFPYEKGGESVTVTTDQRSVRFLLISGKPLNEPIAWYGPIVMNTHAELRQAFQEYQDGTFIK